LTIKNFIPEKYFTIESETMCNGTLLKLICDKKYNLLELEKAKSYSYELNRNKGIVRDIIEREIILNPPKLFSLSKLQSKLSKENKISFAKSLEIIQKLYEKGFITYPRTNTEYLAEEEKDELLNTLNNSHEDIDMAVAFSLGAGIMNEGLMRKRKENRGISIELFNCLKLENLDPLDWHIKAFEFLMVYAICEQAVKEYLVSKGNNSRKIKEDTLLYTLFDELGTSNLKDNFIKEIKKVLLQLLHLKTN